MKRSVYIRIVMIFFLFITGLTVQAQQDNNVLNPQLADSLSRLVEADQVAARMPEGAYKRMSREAWDHFKDSVFSTHQLILEKIFTQHGYPGYDMVGKEGSGHFWLMVQHCDKKPLFQQQVLEAMKKEVDKGNADPKNYAYLTDRVRLNTGQKQVYGTQMAYNTDSCQALPKPLEDSLHVNIRRKALGMEPLEKYLNMMSELHFEMNKESYRKKGIKQAKLYEE